MRTISNLQGWGAAAGASCTHGLWSEAATAYHINVLELLAMETGLKYLLVDCQDQKIRAVSDNTNAVSYINGIVVSLCLVIASLA